MLVFDNTTLLSKENYVLLFKISLKENILMYFSLCVDLNIINLYYSAYTHRADDSGSSKHSFKKFFSRLSTVKDPLFSFAHMR